jgi:hypothetical protein
VCDNSLHPVPPPSIVFQCSLDGSPSPPVQEVTYANPCIPDAVLSFSEVPEPVSCFGGSQPIWKRSWSVVNTAGVLLASATQTVIASPTLVPIQDPDIFNASVCLFPADSSDVCLGFFDLVSSILALRTKVPQFEGVCNGPNNVEFLTCTGAVCDDGEGQTNCVKDESSVCSWSSNANRVCFRKAPVAPGTFRVYTATFLALNCNRSYGFGSSNVIVPYSALGTSCI